MVLNKRLQAIVDALKIAEQKTNERYSRWLEEQIRTIFISVITSWYSDYQPRWYQRNESLYNILETNPGDAGYVDLRTSSDNVTPTRSGDRDYIYILTYRQGWHGGAWSETDGNTASGPRYRKPYKRWTYWGSIAKHSPAPIGEFQRLLDQVLDDDTRNGVYQTIAREETSKVLTK